MSGWTSRHRLSRHFTLGEFSDWHRHRLPPADSHAGLVRLCTVLEKARAHFGSPCHVHSGYRTSQTNQEVGGAPASRHLYDRFPQTPAADVTIESASPEHLFDYLDSLHVGGLGLYRSHVHVDLRSGRARWSDLAAE